jgi:hypothetical protein
MRRIALAVMLTAALGCGGGGDDGGTAGGGAATATRYCNLAQEGVCVRVTAPGANIDNVWQTNCLDAGGTEALSACSATARWGRCTFQQGGVVVQYHLYPPMSLPEAESFCAALAQASFTWQAD